MTMGWVLPPNECPLAGLGREFMRLLLSGTPDGPLPKLLDTLGQGRVLAGMPRLEAFRQPVLTMGLEPVESRQVEQVEEAIVSQLDLLAWRGFEANYLERALDLLELRLRENVTGPRPRGGMGQIQSNS